MQPPHNLNIQRLQRVASGLDKVHAGVDPVVDNVGAVHLVLGIEISIEARFNVFNNGSPRLVIVDKVAKSGSVDNS